MLFLSVYCCLSIFGFAQSDLLAANSPPNDNFESRTVISGPALQVVGSNANATRQADEPYHGDSSGGASIWYAWTAPGAGLCTVSTEGSSFYTLLSVYCGGAVTNLSRIALAPLFSGENGTSKTSFYAIAGATYAIAVDGYYAATGQVHLSLALSAPSLVNSWTKTASGSWEESTWSLGVQPQASQSVFLTNTGFKAVSISSQTVSQSPASLTLSNLFLAAPAGSYNTLLLNYSGTANPLRVQDSLVVQGNSSVRLLNSSIRVAESSSGALLLGGTWIQSDNAQSLFGSAQLGYGNAAEFDLTNGLVTAGELAVGINATGAFNQMGGTVSVPNILTVQNAGGIYNLRNGALSVSTLQIGEGGGAGGAQFVQSGGATTVSNVFSVGDVSYLNLAAGTVALSGGTISTPLLRGVRGTISQRGGSNYCAVSQLGGYNSCTYFLSGGSWFSGDEYLGYHGAAFVNQSGGLHMVTNALYVSAYGGYSGEGTYNLSNGTLNAGSLYVRAHGMLNQSGGTIVVPATFGIGNGGIVSLMAGTLRSARAYLGDTSLEEPPVFTQTGGAWQATNDFTISAGICKLLGGSLVTSNITVVSGVLTNGGCSISNPGLFNLYGGTLYSGGHSLQLGKLGLSGHPTLSFKGGPATVRFAASASQPWYDFSLLTIDGWAGSTNGAGAHQLICGTTSAGLSAQQLGKIIFRNPTGLAPGVYLARILPTGEVVPAQAPAVTYAQQPNKLVVSWPAGFTLQTATNIAGPFFDLPEAASPFTNNIANGEPQRFFRVFHY